MLKTPSSFNNFDNIALLYDTISQMVFGKRLKRIQQYHLRENQDLKRILIFGGGSGEILEHCSIEYPHAEITFVELSNKMLQLAKKRVLENHRFKEASVDFVQGDIRFFKPVGKFDLIILPFILDVLNSEEIKSILNQINTALSAEGKLIVTDFDQHGKAHQLLINFMYLFFRITANLKNEGLAPIRDILFKTGWSEKKISTSTSGLLFSGVYQAKN